MHSGRTLVGTLLAATLALTAAAPSSGAPRTTIDPGSLPKGGKPALAYLDHSAKRIVLPGGRTLAVGNRASDGRLLAARGGWLLTQTRHDDRGRVSGYRVTFVGRNGDKREVTTSRYSPRAVSSDGTWYVADVPGGGRPTLSAVRISDGRTLDVHRFRRFPRSVSAIAVLAAGDGQVLVRTVVPHRKSTYVAATFAWSPTTGNVRVLHRRDDAAPALNGAGSSAAHRYTLDNRVFDSRSQRLLWRAPKGELVLSFSPDDSRVVTTDAPHRDQESPWEMASRIRVRHAATGKLLATFTGHLGSGYSTDGPVWESSGRLLLHASGRPVVVEEAAYYPHQSIVRCSVTSSVCRRVPVPVSDTALVQRRSN